MCQDIPTRDQSRLDILDAELCIIQGAFSKYLEDLGYARLTIGWYKSCLKRTVRFLGSHHRCLSSVSGSDVLPLARRLVAYHHGTHALKMYRAALHAWLSFRSCPVKRAPSHPSGRWQGCVDDYVRFLASDRGLAPATRQYRRRYARCFSAWRFGSDDARWDQVIPQDIWRFSEEFSRRIKPGSANVMLYSLRSFLRFLQLRGFCGPNVVSAVPHYANYGQATRTEALSDDQRIKLLAAFSPDQRGLRDRAIALCLLDLGLRAQEVADLKVTDVDWRQSLIKIPAVKSGKGRQLPLPSHVAAALQTYLHVGRPGCASDHLFLRHRSFAGQPFTVSGLRQTIRRAFRRCGFPRHWTGTHRLRHTFATRLFARGSDPKQIADLLGHSALYSTDSYVQSNHDGLRLLVRQWPS